MTNINDQSHRDLVKRYLKMSEENLRLKNDLASTKRMVVTLQSFMRGQLRDIQAVINLTGGDA